MYREQPRPSSSIRLINRSSFWFTIYSSSREAAPDLLFNVRQVVSKLPGLYRSLRLLLNVERDSMMRCMSYKYTILPTLTLTPSGFHLAVKILGEIPIPIFIKLLTVAAFAHVLGVWAPGWTTSGWVSFSENSCKKRCCNFAMSYGLTVCSFNSKHSLTVPRTTWTTHWFYDCFKICRILIDNYLLEHLPSMKPTTSGLMLPLSSVFEIRCRCRATFACNPHVAHHCPCWRVVCSGTFHSIEILMSLILSFWGKVNDWQVRFLLAEACCWPPVCWSLGWPVSWSLLHTSTCSLPIELLLARSFKRA